MSTQFIFFSVEVLIDVRSEADYRNFMSNVIIRMTLITAYTVYNFDTV